MKFKLLSVILLIILIGGCSVPFTEKLTPVNYLELVTPFILKVNFI